MLGVASGARLRPPLRHEDTFCPSSTQALELSLAPPLSNVLTGLLTYCLRIAVGDGLNDELTRLMDAIMVARPTTRPHPRSSPGHSPPPPPLRPILDLPLDLTDPSPSAAQVGNLAQSMSLVVGPGIAHKVVALTAKPLTYASGWKGPSALSEDSAPSARLVPPGAQAAPTDPRVPPQQLVGLR